MDPMSYEQSATNIINIDIAHSSKLCYGKEWMVMKWREGRTPVLPGKPSVKLILIIIILDEGS